MQNSRYSDFMERTTFWNYGSSYSYGSPSHNILDFSGVFDLSKERKQFPSKEELWSRAKKAVEEDEDRILYNILHFYKEEKIERKVLELFTRELENIALRWTCSSDKAGKVVSKIIRKFENAIFDYLDIRHERTFFALRYAIHTSLSTLSILEYDSLYSSYDLSLSSDYFIEGQISEILTNYLLKTNRYQFVEPIDEFVPYSKKGFIEGEINLDDLFSVILNYMKIYALRILNKNRKKLSEISAPTKIDIFSLNTHYMQCKASLA